ncbi:MAG TPA: hypothetical protein VGL81_10760 [Polyangiaceae bacterium]|jgi:hypothetical protein
MSSALRATLGGTLAVMREEAPGAYGRLCLRLGEVTARLSVDAETVSLSCDGAVVDVDDRPADPRVTIRTDRATLLDLAAARASLVDTILDDRLFARAALPDLVAVEEALVVYLCWAIRNPRARALLRRYRDT